MEDTIDDKTPLEEIEITEIERITRVQLSALDWERQVSRWKFEGITAGQLRLYGQIRDALDELNKISKGMVGSIINHHTFTNQLREKQFYIDELIKKIP